MVVLSFLNDKIRHFFGITKTVLRQQNRFTQTYSTQPINFYLLCSTKSSK